MFFRMFLKHVILPFRKTLGTKIKFTTENILIAREGSINIC